MGGKHESNGESHIMRGKLSKGSPGKNGPIKNGARKEHGHKKKHSINKRFSGISRIKTGKQKRRR